jgi:NAD(P)-dependent dehydrogenase (short-subunit alcohol dehydrogenase family)
MDFKDKNVVVVGGSSGIGASVVEKLNEGGANIWNLARRKSEVSRVNNVELDVTAEFDKIDGLPEKVDGVVYCPGSINLKPFQSLHISDFQNDFNINVLGAVKVFKAVLKSLKKAETASIVMFSTVAVTTGLNFHTSVAAAKGAVEGVVKSLAAEWSRSNIRVNAIAPSLTDTPMAQNLLSSDEKRKTSADRHPLKRVGSSDEMADAVLFLLSNQSSWMTGQVLHIDGGMSSLRPI